MDPAAILRLFEALPIWAKLIQFGCLIVFFGLFVFAPKANVEGSKTVSAETGLTQVRPSVSNESLKAFLAPAKNSLRILVPWLVDPLSLIELLSQKTNDEAFVVQIILMDPKSPYLKKRGEIVQPSQPNYGPQEATRTLMALAEAFKGKKSRNIRIYVNSLLPSIFIAQADNSALVGFHLNTGVATRNPHLEIALKKDEQPTVLGTMVLEELEKVISKSNEVDLKTIRQIDSDSVTFGVVKPK